MPVHPPTSQAAIEPSSTPKHSIPPPSGLQLDMSPGRKTHPVDGGKALDADVGRARDQRLVIADHGARGGLQL